MNNLLSIQTSNISLLDLSLNFAIAFFLSGIVGWHYQKRSKTKLIRKDLGYILPIIALTTLLVIVVVKSSLALSLGLVGALSIVRFRTPIKEPDELAYIFLSIAIGLCLGANQREIAFIGVFVVLVAVTLIDLFRSSKEDQISSILLTFETTLERPSDDVISELIEIMKRECTGVNVRRIESESNTLLMSSIVQFEKFESVGRMNTLFLDSFPDGHFSYLDDSSFPSE